MGGLRSEAASGWIQFYNEGVTVSARSNPESSLDLEAQASRLRITGVNRAERSRTGETARPNESRSQRIRPSNIKCPRIRINSMRLRI